MSCCLSVSSRLRGLRARGQALAFAGSLLLLGARVANAAPESPSEPAPTSSAEASGVLGVDDVLLRVDTLDPRLYAKVLERVEAEVMLARARHDRLRSAIGAEASYGAGRSGWFPSGAGSPWTGQGYDGASGGAFAEVRLPLYAGGAIVSGIEAQAANVAALRHDHEATRKELRRAALVAYGRAVAAERQVEVARAGRERTVSLFHIAENRRASGIGSEAEVARARLALVRREEDVASRESDAEVAQAGLRALVMLPIGLALSLRDSLDRLRALGPNGESRYPEWQRAEEDIRSAEAQVNVARAGYLPTVELVGSVRYGTGPLRAGAAGLGAAPAAMAGQSALPPLSGEALGGVVATFTVFDGFVTQDRVRRAQARAALARARKEDVVRVSLAKWDDAEIRERKADERLSLLQGGGVAARDAVRLARARYESGNAILTEVLDAELEAVALESRVVQAELDRAVAHIDRLRASGVGP